MVELDPAALYVRLDAVNCVNIHISSLYFCLRKGKLFSCSKVQNYSFKALLQLEFNIHKI